jgi:GWxTD domain-containing protein
MKIRVRLVCGWIVTAAVFLPAIPPGTGLAVKARNGISPQDIAHLAPTLQRELAALHYFLNPYQIKQFISLENDSLRGKWLSTYWKSQDPTPTTTYNEKLIEHAIRARLAEQFFNNEKWPGWDKRGEVFIRYGPPSYRGVIYGEVTMHDMHPPGELWYYKRHHMLISFQNYSLSGEYIFSINPLGDAQDASPELMEFLLYDTDESLASFIPADLLEFYHSPVRDEDNETAYRTRNPDVDPNLVVITTDNRPKTRGIPESIDAIMDQDLAAAMPKDVSRVFQQDELEKVANNFEKTLQETPASYPYNFTHQPLPFYFSVDQFKGGDRINRVEVNIELPVGSDGLDSLAADETYKATAIVWDTQFNELSRREHELVLKSGAGAGKWSKLIPTQLVFSLDEGYYRLGIALESETMNKSTTYKTTLTTEQFGGRLALSDLLFASTISQLEESTMWARGALSVVPHPLRMYRKFYSVPVYFETYNLGLDENGVSSFRVEYVVIPHDKKKRRFRRDTVQNIPIVSSSFKASGYNPDEPQYFRLGSENLQAGSFDLIVTVTDEINRTTARRKATFTIID